MSARGRVVRGGADLLVPAHLHYGRYVLDRLLETARNTALINAETGESISNGEIAQKAVNCAVTLKQHGLKRGDVIAVCSENRFEYIVGTLGAICCGATVATISVVSMKDELIHSLNISKPRYIFCSPYALKAHYNSLKSLKYIETIIQFGDQPLVPGLLFNELISKYVDIALYEPEDVKGQVDTMMVLCSSGTTGLPKGVMLTHLNFMLSSVLMSTNSNYAERGLSRFLTIVPWHHAYGFMSTYNFICAGVTVVYITKFQEDLYLQSIDKYQINTLVAVPPLVVFLAKSPKVLDYDMSSLREIWCGAAPLSLDIIEATKKRFPTLHSINQAYGMTETSLAATRDQNTSNYSKAGSGGCPVSGTKLKVVDLETRKILGPYEKGEICVKGGIIMKGYIGDAAATINAFDEEGYLKTGDIGYYDDDDYFYIVDRVKELIKYKGYQVPPAEVEGVLLQHPAVKECGVVGAPDEASGELPTAFVVKQPGASVTEKELVDFVASKLSRAKHLHGGVRFLEEIPKNPSGKILRRVLKEKYLNIPISKL